MKQLRTFQAIDMAKAFAIVNVFETGRPFGGFASLAVLNDGAGISYGISQFTHRSGALFEVVSRYMAGVDSPEQRVIHESLPLLSFSDERSIRTAAADRRLKQALVAAASTSGMRRAQIEVAFSRYLAPAIAACAGSDFHLPLSLAVIYDSINHGSYENIRDRVSIAGLTDADAGRFEREWIASYVTTRHLWLGRVAR
ncbi:MAG: chitosanase, partial [Acidobacteriota bacterium]